MYLDMKPLINYKNRVTKKGMALVNVLKIFLVFLLLISVTEVGLDFSFTDTLTRIVTN